MEFWQRKLGVTLLFLTRMKNVSLCNDQLAKVVCMWQNL